MILAKVPEPGRETLKKHRAALEKTLHDALDHLSFNRQSS
jgi:hypothetical protein